MLSIGSMEDRVQLIDAQLLDASVQKALQAPRLRTNHNFHSSDNDNPHRFLNALARGTYCAPHRHAVPPKAETFVALRGQVAVLLFEDSGALHARHVIGAGGLLGIDIPAGVWHSIAVLSDTAVCFEVKPGPWDPASDKEFAPWAPREGDPRASAYLARLVADLG